MQRKSDNMFDVTNNTNVNSGNIRKTSPKSFFIRAEANSYYESTFLEENPKYRDKDVIVLQIMLGQPVGKHNEIYNIYEIIYKEDYEALQIK